MRALNLGVSLYHKCLKLQKEGFNTEYMTGFCRDKILSAICGNGLYIVLDHNKIISVSSSETFHVGDDFVVSVLTGSNRQEYRFSISLIEQPDMCTRKGVYAVL